MANKPDEKDRAAELKGPEITPKAGDEPVIDTGETDAEVEAQVAEDPAASADPFVRAEAAGIGKIEPRGGEAYVGLSPAREADPASATGPNGFPVNTKTSTFTPLRDVPFSTSAVVKDPASGTFYHPDADTSSWEDCNLDGALLIPAATTPPITRKKAA